MLKFIRKSHYWDILDRGVDKKFEQIGNWHLKNIQDCAIADLMDGVKGKKIAEIGGGKSRILKWLLNDNKTSNIETFQGADGGPSGKIEIPGVENIYCLVGDSKDQIEDEAFDIIFSVSVVEHIAVSDLDNFIKDCWRLLKPGGKMYHAVDMYLTNDPEDDRFNYNLRRIREYSSAFAPNMFKPLERMEITQPSDIMFATDIATNPDNVMRQWNNKFPSLKPLRENSQSVSLLWCGQK